MQAEHDVLLDRMACDIDAERALIGSMMLDPEAVDLVASIINPSDMFRPIHQVLFQAIIDVNERAVIPDAVAIHELLERNGQVNQPDGELTTEYIGEIFHETPTAANAEYYARIVKDRSVRRQLNLRGREIVRDANDLSNEINDIVDAAHGKILDISASAAIRHVTDLRETLTESLASIEKKQERGGEKQ